MLLVISGARKRFCLDATIFAGFSDYDNTKQQFQFNLLFEMQILTSKVDKNI